MPSSPADPAIALRELIAAYDAAFGHALQGDHDAARRGIDAAERLLAGLQGVPLTAAAAELHEQARAAQGRLGAALQGAQKEIVDELARVRQGRKLLASYGDPTLGLGGRVESRA